MSPLGRLLLHMGVGSDPESLLVVIERQHGVTTREQLLAAGLGRNAVAYRVRTARLHLLHPGVYAVGHRRLRAEGVRLATLRVLLAASGSQGAP
jgi:hypothetical protein